MKLSEMFPSRFVRGQDLQSPILAQITGIERETVHPRAGVEEEKFILRFERIDPRTGKPAPLSTVVRTRAGHGVILRRVLAEQIAEALGADDTDAWIGQRVVLAPADARAGNRTVKTIVARAPKNGS